MPVAMCGATACPLWSRFDRADNATTKSVSQTEGGMIPELNGWKEKLHAGEGKRGGQSEGERESGEQRHCCGRNKLIYAFPCRSGDKKKTVESLPYTWNSTEGMLVHI